MPTPSHSPTRLAAILQAILVTFLWSTSWVLIKFGLSEDLPAITFAGLRYVLAFLCLAPFILFQPGQREALRGLGRRDWIKLALLGLAVYTVTQGAQFVGLAYLPTATLNLVLNMTAAFTALAGIAFLREHPTPLQWVGTVLTVAGVLVYFLPVAIPHGQAIGLLAALACLAGNVVSSILSRQVNRERRLPPLLVTFVSMGIGSLLMLAIGLATQGIGRLAWQDWAIIAWLAVVNTALTFTLWNNTLRTLSAMESSIINSLMMPQIALLALLFLDEIPTAREILGLGLVFAGVIVVALRNRTK
jgi:drug/metabolite transporter (DMT)-like permease